MPNLNLFVVALGAMFIASVANAQKIASVSGSWNASATWGGQAPPTAADYVYINDNVNVTVTANAACANLTINGGNNPTTLTINNGVTLNVTTSMGGPGMITMNVPTDGSSDKTIALAGSGSILNCRSIDMYNPSGNVDNDILNVNTGTVNVTYNITMYGTSAENEVNVSAGGKLVIGGINSNGALNLAPNSIVEYTGAAQTIRPANYRFLVLSGSGLKTVTGVTVFDKLTLRGTATLAGPIGYNSAELEYNGSAQQNISTNEFGPGMTQFIINNVHGVMLTFPLNTAADIILAAGTFDTGSNFRFLLSQTDFAFITVSGGSFTGAIQGLSEYHVIYNGNSKTTGGELSGGGLTSITINLNTGQTLTLDQNRSTFYLTINSGTFDIGTFTINGVYSIPSHFYDFSMGAGASLRIGGTNGLPSHYNYYFNAASTVFFEGTNQVIAATTYGNLRIYGTGTKTMSGATTIAGNLAIDLETTLDQAAVTTTLGAGSRVTVVGTLDFSNSLGRIRTGNNVPAVLIMSGNALIKTANSSGLGPAVNASLQTQGTGTWTTTDIDSRGTVEYYLGAAQTVTDRNYNNLKISNAGGTKTWTLAAARTVRGSLTITDGPFTLAGAANLYLKADWSKGSGTFTPGPANIVFNGSNLQTIGGTTGTTFNNVIINNSSPTSVYLARPATITGSMTFTDGIVYSSFSNILTFNDNATAVGATDASFVDGPVTKVGDDPFTFPIGKDGVGLHTAAIWKPDLVTDAFSAAYIRGSGTGLGPVTAPGLINVSNCEYWYIHRDAGNSQPVLALSWTASSPCNSNPYITNLSGLTIASFNGTLATPSWDTYAGTATGTVTTGTVTRTAVSNAVWNSSNRFTLGNISAGQNTLPVKISNIKAYEKQSGIQIVWTAYKEVNLSNYEIQRSADGQTFTTIGTIAAHHSQVETKYGFFDPNPLPGVSFYRLRSVDFDGKSSYSNIVRVNLDRNVKEITLYPNPVRNGYISFQSSDLAKGNYNVKIFTAGGQEVYNQRFNHTGGAINQTIQLPATVKAGMYMIQLDNDGAKVMAKAFIVQ